MQSRLKEAVVLAVAILGLGAFLYCAMIHVKDRDRVVFVRGLAEREVPAALKVTLIPSEDAAFIIRETSPSSMERITIFGIRR